MYRASKYQKDDKDFIYSFIEHHPFATFVLNGERLLATHIPILLEGEVSGWRLFSHIANHNEQLKYLKEGAEALVIFQGANAYISSSWYKEKDISTWDYSAVHVNAKIKLQTAEELENSLKELVSKFEKKQDKPLYYDNIPRKMLDEHLPLITGFWLEPYKVEGIAKLHQAYPKHDIEEVTKHLLSSEDTMKNDLGQAIKKENNIK
ncbi:FMN-binding negative transcriptional regulator [Christiangramia forsetii]|uniref:Negative transcriptional regulator n=2 Tax=Christiangramia forsetii TaxID=411153 RepID=A0LX98_CHRFK|nr:FMN-binding negative transcriptional regulator [Christiangramia forsetii]GGG27790.1 protease synthase and sporulation protein PAI 2 [Christiangramia forsetii]CAL64993.1 negative transcriptional regulator [Christiangramia forsetii KT0803]